MQEKIIHCFISISIGLFALLFNVLSAVECSAVEPKGEAEGTVYVEVKSAKLRSQPLHWAPALADLSYGDALFESNRQSGWLTVRLADGRAGFVHESAVTAKMVVLKASEVRLGTEGASTDIVLAGKGFSQDVEDSYAGERTELDYAKVSAIENFKVPDKALAKFISEGGLIAPAG